MKTVRFPPCPPPTTTPLMWISFSKFIFPFCVMEILMHCIGHRCSFVILLCNGNTNARHWALVSCWIRPGSTDPSWREKVVTSQQPFGGNRGNCRQGRTVKRGGAVSGGIRPSAKKRRKSVTFVTSVMFLAVSYSFTFENKWGSVKQKNTLEHILECY